MIDIPQKTMEDMRKKANIWLRYSVKWTYTHRVINILGITMSCLAASTVAESAAPYFSVVAAICFGINGFANPQKQASRNVRGYLILDDALLRAECGLMTVQGVHDARGRAELEVHGSSEPTPQTSSSPTTK